MQQFQEFSVLTTILYVIFALHADLETFPPYKMQPQLQLLRLQLLTGIYIPTEHHNLPSKYA